MNQNRLALFLTLGLLSPGMSASLAAQTGDPSRQTRQEAQPAAQLWQLQIGGISG